MTPQPRAGSPVTITPARRWTVSGAQRRGTPMTRFAAAALAVAFACPHGTARWSDGWGNPTCASVEPGHETVTVAPGPSGVPHGYTRSLDPFGTPIARDPSGGTYYGTAPGR